MTEKLARGEIKDFIVIGVSADCEEIHVLDAFEDLPTIAKLGLFEMAKFILSRQPQQEGDDDDLG